MPAASNIETHPFKPFLPEGARLLMLGTFPPARKRWCMEWYYPNFQNDMWRIMGLCFKGDKSFFVDSEAHTFRLTAIRQCLTDHHIAIFDTALRIRRTKGTASDKDLEIVEPADLDHLLGCLPCLSGVLTAGSLATKVFATHYGIDTGSLAMGGHINFRFGQRTLSLYREPSSSRAFPMKVEEKARYYQAMFGDLGL